MVTLERPGRLAQALESLRTLHIDRLSCIRRRTLATALLDLGLIDNVYLTTGAGPAGDPGTAAQGEFRQAAPRLSAATATQVALIRDISSPTRDQQACGNAEMRS